MSGVAGDNVADPMPKLDRGKGDTRNIVGVIIKRDEEKRPVRKSSKAR